MYIYIYTHTCGYAYLELFTCAHRSVNKPENQPYSNRRQTLNRPYTDPPKNLNPK